MDYWNTTKTRIHLKYVSLIVSFIQVVIEGFQVERWFYWNLNEYVSGRLGLQIGSAITE